MKRQENLQTCAKHKRRMTFICRNIDKCECGFKLFCERCISAIKKNNLKKSGKDSSDHHLFEVQHDFELYEDFIDKIDSLCVTHQNLTEIQAEILRLYSQSEISSQMLRKRISHDLLVSLQICSVFQNNLLEAATTHSQSSSNISGDSQIIKLPYNQQICSQFKVFYSDKIVQKYSNLLQSITSQEENQKNYKETLCSQFASLKGKYIKQHKFDGIQRQFPKYFVLQNRFLYVYNQESYFFSQFDLSLGIELPNQIVFPDRIAIPNKCQITPITDKLIAIHHQKSLYFADITEPTKYRRYFFRDLIQNITPYGRNCKKMMIQFKGRLELWIYEKSGIRCLKMFFHPVIQYYNNKCIILQDTKKVIWYSAFSLLNINTINGDIQHHVLTREYIYFNPNFFQQNVDELINDILAQSIGVLRKFSIQSVKQVNQQLFLIQYQDYIEIRQLSDFQLVERIENLQCETISIIYDNILLLTKTKDKTNVQIVNLQDYSLRQLFSSKELYTKAIYCDSKLYLLKHTYFEVSNRNSYFNTLVLDIYS